MEEDFLKGYKPYLIRKDISVFIHPSKELLIHINFTAQHVCITNIDKVEVIVYLYTYYTNLEQVENLINFIYKHNFKK